MPRISPAFRPAADDVALMLLGHKAVARLRSWPTDVREELLAQIGDRSHPVRVGHLEDGLKRASVRLIELDWIDVRTNVHAAHRAGQRGRRAEPVGAEAILLDVASPPPGPPALRLLAKR